MALLLLLALAAIKIDGWFSAVLLIIAMLFSSPAINMPSKSLRWGLIITFVALALLFFPDINQYREAFETEGQNSQQQQQTDHIIGQ